MFSDYLYEITSAEWENKLLIDNSIRMSIDDTALDSFRKNGFSVIHYKDDISFRTKHYNKLLDKKEKIIVIREGQDYVPYDILRRLRSYQLSLEALFPKLNSEVLRREKNLDYDLLSEAYEDNYEDLRERHKTEQFLRDKVYVSSNARSFIDKQYANLCSKIKGSCSYQDWMTFAKIKAKIDVLACQYQIEFDTSSVNSAFQNFIISDYGKLSGIISAHTPILVSKAMDYMKRKSEKFAIIVMDGMSEFDWDIISESFSSIKYTRSAALAMIPTITSISRQCLVSNKYPKELINPWKLNKEEAEFKECAKALGYKDQQIQYGRGYGFNPSSFAKCCCVIINDCDDMVHGQKQGIQGMYQDMKLLSSRGKLLQLTQQLLIKGFDVYISADHGNTECVGMGSFRTGVETETKSHRMIVLKDYADKEKRIQEYKLIEYIPKYYLDQQYDYLLCDAGKSLDDKDTIVMSHGGMTIDEVVVPFIEIKAEYNNG